MDVLGVLDVWDGSKGGLVGKDGLWDAGGFFYTFVVLALVFYRRFVVPVIAGVLRTCVSCYLCFSMRSFLDVLLLFLHFLLADWLLRRIVS